LTWVDFVEGLDSFNRHVMPRLEKIGIRKPFAKQARSSAA
jgi:hypothetical protein